MHVLFWCIAVAIALHNVSVCVCVEYESVKFKTGENSTFVGLCDSQIRHRGLSGPKKLGNELTQPHLEKLSE